MIKIQLSGNYDSMYRELVGEDKELRNILAEKVKWFRRNPEDTRLDNHPLRKSLKGKWAFSINDDIRIVYEWLDKTFARFLSIGRHVRVYHDLS